MSIELVTVDMHAGQAAYPTLPQVSIGFDPDYITFYNIGAKGAFFSFDGVTDHGYVPAPAAGITPVVIRQKMRKVWMKEAAADATLVVYVNLESAGRGS